MVYIFPNILKRALTECLFLFSLLQRLHETAQFVLVNLMLFSYPVKFSWHATRNKIWEKNLLDCNFIIFQNTTFNFNTLSTCQLLFLPKIL